MEIDELMKKNRSYRRFNQAEPIPPGILHELVNLARMSPSSANRQPLKFLLSCEAEKNSCIFSHLSWAGYLRDWPGPEEGERPTAYIIILLDKEIVSHAGFNPGIAAQSILLGAVARGWGGCILGSLNRRGLAQALDLDDRYEIQLVIALGKPAEEIVIEDSHGEIEYYRDEQGVHHVPKRTLKELILPLRT